MDTANLLLWKLQLPTPRLQVLRIINGAFALAMLLMLPMCWFKWGNELFHSSAIIFPLGALPFLAWCVYADRRLAREQRKPDRGFQVIFDEDKTNRI